MVGFIVFIYAVQLAESMLMGIEAVVTVGTMV